MKSYTKALVLSIALLASVTSQASGTTKAGYAACVTEIHLDMFREALRKKDHREMDFLRKSKVCFRIPAGLQFSMLDSGFFTSKARVYANDDVSMVLYAPRGMFR